MKMKLLLLLLICNTSLVFSQKYLWKTFAGTQGNGPSSGQSMVRDKAGNLYVLNSFGNDVYIQGDTISPIAPGNVDIWIGKFDSLGNKLWHRTIFSGGFDAPYDITIDDSANIYILSNSNTTQLSFADTVVQVPQTTNLSKLDSAGNFVWLTSVPYFPSCGVYLAYSSGYIFLKTCAGMQRVNCQSAALGNVLSISGQTISHKGMTVAPNGDILVSMYSDGLTVDTTFLPLTPSPQGNGGNLAFLRIDTALTVKSYKAYGSFLGNIGDYMTPMAVDDSGFVYAPAVCNVNKAYFGNDSITPFNTLLDIVLLKMDSLLNPVKMMPLYRSGSHRILDMIYANEGFYVVGQTGYTEFPNGLQLPASANGDNMILKFNRTGQALWVSSSGSTNSATDYVNRIVSGDNGNLYLSGLAYGGESMFPCETYTNLPGMQLFSMRDYLPVDLPAVKPTYLREGYQVFFDAHLTDGEFVSWNFGDGNSTTVQVNPTHQYAAPGLYTVVLTTQKYCSVRTDTLYLLFKGIQKVLPPRIANNQLQTVVIKGGFPFTTAAVQFIKGAATLTPEVVAVIDSSTIQANFLFHNEALGLYDVVVSSAGFADTLQNGVELVPEDIRLPQVQVIGEPRVVINVFYSYQVAVSNPGNVNQYGVPVYIGTNPKTVLNDVWNHIIRDSINVLMTAALGGDFVLAFDSTTNDSALIGAFLIPVVPANSSEIIEFRMKTTSLGDRLLYAKVGEPIFDSAQLVDLGLRTSCDFLADPMACLLDAAGEIPTPITSCGAAALSLGCAIGNGVNDIAGTRNRKGLRDKYVVDVFNLLSDIAGVATCSGGPFSPKDKINDFLIKFFGQGLNAAAAKLSGSSVSIPTGFTPLDVNIPGSCIDVLSKPFSEIMESNFFFKSASSLDPNDKTGPVGFTPENYINDKNRMHYRIRFENVDTATAPARVEVTDTLDASFFDLSTLRFTGFGFADTAYFLTNATGTYAQEIDLRPAKNTIVRIEAVLDTQSHVITWSFTSLNPVTKEVVTTINDGFLNPNVTSPEGEGYVSYSIMPKANRPHLQQVNNTPCV
ncbi:MAG: PKD domain-containing protein [Bacteroidetes bacterium]|nr:PKD domain-containing protein [Bacteroidota bacterium]